MNDLVLMKLDAARTMLAEAKTIQETKKILDMAEAATIYAKRQQLGQEAVLYATSIKVEALRQLGNMLKETPRAAGGQPYQSTGNAALPVEQLPPTLADLGLDKKTSKLAQDIARLPEAEIERVKLGVITLHQAARQLKRDEYLKTPPLPTDKYRVIYADPPWAYGNTMPDYMGVQDDHYPTMTVKELCALPIKDIADDNAVLFLWVTSPILEESFEVVRAWGFRYKASFIWDKVKHVMGHYNSVRHEFLLVCIRGSCQPDIPKLFDSVVSEERTEHSVKPEQFRVIIDTIYPNGKRIELFARRLVEGWDNYGNDLP